MSLQPAWRSLGYSVANAAAPAQQAPFYRFYLLRADNHIAQRREDYFADDAAAITAARQVIGEFPGVEIWCGTRKVISLSREEVARLPAAPKPTRAAIVINRNQRLRQQAAEACRRSEALSARLMARAASQLVRPRFVDLTGGRGPALGQDGPAG